MAQTVAYNDIESVLQYHNTLVNAAEAHGTLAGMLCMGGQTDLDRWLIEVFDQGMDDISDNDHSTLAQLFDDTQRWLDEACFEFAILMPDEETALSDRASALVDWCHGFLFGIGYSDSDSDAMQLDNCEEVLSDILEISRLDPDADGEEDELAFMELIEYIRVGVQQIHDEAHNASPKYALH